MNRSGTRCSRIDCVVLELDLPDISAFEVLVELVPRVRRPNIVAIVLTRVVDREIYALAKENGAYVCFHKPNTSSDDLDRAINRGIGFVGLLPAIVLVNVWIRRSRCRSTSLEPSAGMYWTIKTATGNAGDSRHQLG
jgi:hypothetical protein